MVRQRILDSYSQMSPGHKKIAQYIDANFVDLTYCSVTELSEKCGASKATIVRFAYNLGFKKYGDMQRQSCLDLNNSQSSGSKSLSSIQDDSATADEKAALPEICRLLMTSKNVLITGYLDSFGVASELLHVLDNMRPNVFFSRHIQNWDELYNIMSGDTTAIFFSFTPHYFHTIATAKAAEERNCNIISITNSPLNPLRQLSQISLSFKLENHGNIPLYDTRPINGYIFEMAKYIRKNYESDVMSYGHSDHMKEKYVLWEE